MLLSMAVTAVLVATGAVLAVAGGVAEAQQDTSAVCGNGKICVWSGSGFSGARVEHGPADFTGACLSETIASLKNTTADQEAAVFADPGCDQNRLVGVFGPGQSSRSFTGRSLRITVTPTRPDQCPSARVCTWRVSGFSGARVEHGPADFTGACLNEAIASLKNTTGDQEATVFADPGCDQNSVVGVVGPGQEEPSLGGQALRIGKPGAAPAGPPPGDCPLERVCVWSGEGFRGSRVEHGSADFTGSCVNEPVASLKNTTGGQEATVYSDPGCDQNRVVGVLGPGQERPSLQGQSLRITKPGSAPAGPPPGNCPLGVVCVWTGDGFRGNRLEHGPGDFTRPCLNEAVGSLKNTTGDRQVTVYSGPDCNRRAVVALVGPGQEKPEGVGGQSLQIE